MGGGRAWGGGGGFGVLVYGGSLFLPEQGQSRPVFPLRSLHTDSVCRYPRPSDAPVGGSYHCDGNPTCDVSTRLRVGLLPL